jgi:ATP-dependent protease HslVU (ClpYQ) peptidase subunit
VYKDGTLAADTQLTNGNVKMTCTKIKRLTKHLAIACAGDTTDEYKAHKYFADPNWKDKEPPVVNKKFECILIHHGIPYFCLGNLYPVLMEHHYYAIGSGWTFGLAGCQCGFTAEIAVQFASQFDAFTNNKVETFHVSEHQEAQGKKPKVAP